MTVITLSIMLSVRDRILKCIQFKLLVLNINGYGLKELPDNLPNWLHTIYCNDNQITQLPNNLPSSLKYLHCCNNLITELPSSLPSSLECLNCSGNKIIKLPNNLPTLLKYLDCSNNDLNELHDNLPSSLERLNCYGNKLVKFPDKLPYQLKDLICSKNQIIKITDNLPSSLRRLFCSSNKLIKLPNLPNILNQLSCGNEYLYLPRKYVSRCYLSYMPHSINYNKNILIIHQNWKRNKCYKIMINMLNEDNDLSKSFSSDYGDINLVRLICLFY